MQSNARLLVRWLARITTVQAGTLMLTSSATDDTVAGTRNLNSGNLRHNDNEDMIPCFPL